MSKTGCQCEVPPEGELVYCEHHQREKNAHLVQLCQTHDNYFNAPPRPRPRSHNPNAGQPYDEDDQAFALELCDACEIHDAETDHCILDDTKLSCPCRKRLKDTCSVRAQSPNPYCPRRKW